MSMAITKQRLRMICFLVLSKSFTKITAPHQNQNECHRGVNGEATGPRRNNDTVIINNPSTGKLAAALDSASSQK